jgi:hypothetical protein
MINKDIHSDHANFKYEGDHKKSEMKPHTSTIDLDEEIVKNNPEMKLDDNFDKDVSLFKNPFKYCL